VERLANPPARMGDEGLFPIDTPPINEAINVPTPTIVSAKPFIAETYSSEVYFVISRCLAEGQILLHVP